MREFRVDSEVRRKSAVSRVLRGLAAIFGVAAAVKLARGIPLLEFAYSDLIVLLLLPLLFFFRGRWGDRLVFEGAEVRVYRGDALRQTVPMAAVEKVAQGDDSLSLKWRSGGRTEHQLIAKEGFSDEDWQAIRSLLESGLSEPGSSFTE